MILDFIWHLRGSVSLNGRATDEVALRRVERLLRKQRKPVTEQGSDCIAFEAPLWRDLFGPNWLAMVIYNRGRFWIERDAEGRRLRYELCSLHGLVFCLSVALLVFVIDLAIGDIAGGLKHACFVVGWLYGMNILLALGRVPGSIRKAIREP